MARSNVIELVAQWRDQGASRGLQETARSVSMLTNALGTAAGFGAIGAINVLARHLGTLIRAPLQAADAMAQLAREGQKVAPVFTELAKAQDQAAQSWREFSQEVARHSAPTAKALAEVSAATGSGATWLVGGLAGFSTAGQYANRFRGAGSALGFTPPVQGAPYGPWATPEQLDSAKRLEAIRLQEEAALKAINAELTRARDLDRQRAVNAQAVNASLYGMDQTPQTYNEYLAEGVQPYGPQTWEEWMKAGQPVAEIARDPVAWAAQAASSVSSAISFASAQLVSGLSSLGGVARAFWQSLVMDIAGIVGQMGIGSLLGTIGGSIGGPIGGFIGAIGGKLIGKTSASGSRRGDTYIFNGLNTRDMYMELTTGSLRRANDLVLMRGAEVGA